MLKTLKIDPQGLVVSGPLDSNSKLTPQSLEEALWQFRFELLESGLAQTTQPKEANNDVVSLMDYVDDTFEEEISELDVTELWLPYTSLPLLKENFAEPAAGEAMPDIFEPVLSDWLPPLTDWTL